jgi:hypothetical protein
LTLPRSWSGKSTAWECQHERDWAGTKPQINDMVIRGCLLSINEGSSTKRVTIGFGYGASELRTATECLPDDGSRTAQTRIRHSMDSSSGKAPGAALGVGAATFIVTANPMGLIISSGIKVYGEASGRNKIEGRAEGNRQGNCQGAQAAISGTGLDQIDSINRKQKS